MPPPPHLLHDALSAWEKYLHAETAEPPLVKIALLHYQFEAIHPFLDGNGRIGRLLTTLFFCERGLLTEPLLYLSSYFERIRDDYYRNLLAVSTQAAWKDWLVYFLTGVRDTAKEALADTRRLVDLYEHYRNILAREKRTPSACAGVLDALFASQMLSIAQNAERKKDTFQNLSKAVEYWQKHGIVREVTKQRRNRIFAAPPVIDITRPRPAPPIS